MALRRRGFVSVGAVVACCALAAACSPDQAPVSTPSPTPAATPAESQIERQIRLDYEAAEKAYRGGREGISGSRRAGSAVLSRSGATKASAALTEATSALKATATGSYLRITVEVAAPHSGGGLACDGNYQRLWALSQWRPCDSLTIRRARTSLLKIERRYVQELTVVKVGERGRSRRPTTKVKSFEGQPCAAYALVAVGSRCCSSDLPVLWPELMPGMGRSGCTDIRRTSAIVVARSERPASTPRSDEPGALARLTADRQLVMSTRSSRDAQEILCRIR